MKRRHFLASAGLLTIAGCSALPSGNNQHTATTRTTTPDNSLSEAPPCTNNDSWQSCRGNKKNTGKREYISFEATTPNPSTASDAILEGTSPVADEDRIYLVSRTQVLAISRRTKEALWQTEITESGAVSPLVTCHSVLVQTGDSLRALHPETGDEIWQTGFGNGATKPNLISTEDSIFAVSTAGVLRLAHDGTVQWKNQPSEHVLHGLAHAGDRIVVTESTSDGGRVFGFSAASGETLWKTDAISSVVEPVIGSNHAYVLEQEGVLRALALDSGEEDWAFEIAGDTALAPPALDISRGQLYVPTGSSGNLVAIDIESGTKVWQTSVDSSAHTPVAVTREAIYHSGSAVRRIDPKSGDIDWEITEFAGSGGLALTTDGLWVNADRSLVHMN